MLFHKAFHLNGERREDGGKVQVTESLWPQVTGDVSQIQVRERMINAFS